MTRREDDKRGNDEFGNYDDAEYNRKVEARHTKEMNAKSLKDHKGKDTYPRKMGKSHREDRG